MLSEDKREFSRENIDIYLKEIAKEYRKLTGKSMPAELILIGGASILINYSFRNPTFHFASIVEIFSVVSSNTSNSIRTVSSDVSMVTLFCAAVRRIATPSP